MNAFSSRQRHSVLLFAALIFCMTAGLHYYFQSLSEALQAKLATIPMVQRMQTRPHWAAVCAPWPLFKQLTMLDLGPIELTRVRAQGKQIDVQGMAQTPFDWLRFSEDLQAAGWQIIRWRDLTKHGTHYLFHFSLGC